MAPLPLGEKGERKACRMLRRKGFRILERNYRCKAGEVDIVAAKRGLLVFCEVKARRDDAFAPPYEAVNRGKMLRLDRAAQSWLARNRRPWEQYRFDVVSLVSEGKRWKAQHLEDAFRPEW
jgi:putative endonuclease